MYYEDQNNITHEDIDGIRYYQTNIFFQDENNNMFLVGYRQYFRDEDGILHHMFDDGFKPLYSQEPQDDESVDLNVRFRNSDQLEISRINKETRKILRRMN
jgi:hypothetical protein